MKKHLFAVSLIFALTLLTYANSFKNEFVYDDHSLIVENEFIKNPKNLTKIFSRDYFFLAREKSYRPLCTTSFFLDYSLWKLNVFGWHLTNLSLHIANAILVYFLVTFIFSQSSTKPINLSTYQPIFSLAPASFLPFSLKRWRSPYLWFFSFIIFVFFRKIYVYPAPLLRISTRKVKILMQNYEVLGQRGGVYAVLFSFSLIFFFFCFIFSVTFFFTILKGSSTEQIF